MSQSGACREVEEDLINSGLGLKMEEKRAGGKEASCGEEAGKRGNQVGEGRGWGERKSWRVGGTAGALLFLQGQTQRDRDGLRDQEYKGWED